MKKVIYNFRYLFIVFLFSIDHIQVQGKIIDGVEVNDAIGIARFTSSKYNSSGLTGLATGFNNRLSLRISFFSTTVRCYAGIQYSSESIGGRVILNDEKYSKESISSYGNDVFSIPLGIKIKLNKPENKLSFLTGEIDFGF